MERVNREIILLRLSSLGDVAMLVPVLLSFHKKYPDQKIKLISREKFQPIFKKLDFVTFVAIDNGGKKLTLWHLLHFFYRFSSKKNIQILDLHDVLRTKILCFLFCLYGNKIYRIEKGREEKKKMIIDRPKQIYSLKTTQERYAEVFHAAGFGFSLISITPNFQNYAPNIFNIGIAPFAQHASKEINIEYLKSLIMEVNKIETFKKIEFHLFGYGSRELFLAEKLMKGLSNAKIWINKIHFVEELEKIAQMNLFISMDSGNGHLAANFGIPVLTLWGTTHPCLGFAPHGQPVENWFFPNKNQFPYLPTSIYGKNKAMEYERAIDSIDIKKVAARVGEIIKQ